MLNLNQLRVFYEAARVLNFSAAAETLYVTQPAVSKQVKSLEDLCGLRLFVKKRNKIDLTDEGKKVFVYAARIFELERQLEEVINGLKNLRHGSLRIGTTKTYARWFMPPLLSMFQKKMPNVIIELDEGSSLEMSKSLVDFKNSLAIVPKIENDPNVRFIPFMVEEVVLIATPDHPLAGRMPVGFVDLAEEPIVMKEMGSGTRKLVEEHFFKEKIKPNTVAQTSNMEFLKQMVKQKKAISFVVKSSVEQELSDGYLVSVPVKNQKLLLEICLAYLGDYELPQAAKGFLDFIRVSTQGEHLAVGVESVLRRISESNRQ